MLRRLFVLVAIIRRRLRGCGRLRVACIIVVVAAVVAAAVAAASSKAGVSLCGGGERRGFLTQKRKKRRLFVALVCLAVAFLGLAAGGARIDVVVERRIASRSRRRRFASLIVCRRGADRFFIARINV